MILSIGVKRVSLKNMHEILYLFALFVDLKHVWFKEVIARSRHVDLNASTDNYLATMERSHDLKDKVSCDFKHGIGNTGLRVRVRSDLSIFRLHVLDNERELLIQGASS